MKIRRFIPSVFISKVLTRTFIIIVLTSIIFPLLWMFSLAFRRFGETTLSRFLIFPVNVETGNFQAAIENAAARGTSIPILFKNSIIITFISIAATIIIASIAGYAFAKFRFKGRMSIFYSILIGMMIPMQLSLIHI